MGQAFRLPSAFEPSSSCHLLSPRARRVEARRQAQSLAPPSACGACRDVRYWLFAGFKLVEENKGPCGDDPSALVLERWRASAPA